MHKNTHVYSITMHRLGIETRRPNQRYFHLHSDVDNLRAPTLERAREVCEQWEHLMAGEPPRGPCYCEITNLETLEVFDGLENGNELTLMKLMHGRPIPKEIYHDDAPEDMDERLLCIVKY